MSKKNRHHTVAAPTSASIEYRPSDQAQKYNVPAPQYKYKVVAHRNDYIRLQEEVSKYLDEGWQLAGGLATAVHADQYNVNTVFAQAIFKK